MASCTNFTLHSVATRIHKIGSVIRPTKCTVKYSTLGNLITKPHYPFEELSNCMNHTCNPGEYKCREYFYCVRLENICDGISQCLKSDDEIYCGR